MQLALFFLKKLKCFLNVIQLHNVHLLNYITFVIFVMKSWKHVKLTRKYLNISNKGKPVIFLIFARFSLFSFIYLFYFERNHESLLKIFVCIIILTKNDISIILFLKVFQRQTFL